MKTILPALALTALLSTVASAATVDARLSSREAYVGMPVTLQLSISDATDYQQPKLPTIDGCDIRSAGTPSQSSQITIINGRRSESRSVTMQYLITPRRLGRFNIPPLTLEVDGKTVTTEPLRFVATKSETGDLMFVEIEGGTEKVFVGQPLDLKLKIWLRPFRDRQRSLTLSEDDMWNMISDHTSWGGFAARIKEMAENNQRPGCQEVLRDDGNGNQRSYYLYEIDATVYPKRPGKIDADDVQIVVNYPTGLGKSRSPFSGFLDDDMFGGNSPMARMMNDDFFGSPFGNRLAVSSTRPIVGEVSVDSTEVVPVPREGRPADYRGAVGRYRIVMQATPTTVDAGDPITLNIGIAGTGPMELVQAPPLFAMSSLTANFKVADQSLAGFVKDDTKVFSTTIRPRKDGITEIPPIRFSFFDPEAEKYETVMSDPIAITVHKSESLAIDAIVGNGRAIHSPLGGTSVDAAPDFTNNADASVLMSQTPRAETRWWWLFVIVPPILCLGTLLTRQRRSIARRLPSFKSAKARCLAAIERAEDGEAIEAALIQFIARRTGKRCPTTSSAIGSLRVAGSYNVAGEVESFCQSLERKPKAARPQNAIALVQQLDDALAVNPRNRVRLPQQRTSKIAAAMAHRSLGLFLATAVALSAGDTTAEESNAFSPAQQETLLAEASDTYSRGLAMTQTDSAAAKELLAAATSKYQLLIDSGIHNSDLYTNVGNAYLQTGDLGRAIASYEQAKQLNPSDQQVLKNLEFANAKVEKQPRPAEATTAGGYWIAHLRSANDAIVSLVGTGSVIFTLGIASVLFWGLVTLRALGRQFPVFKSAAAPLLVLVVSLGSMVLTETTAAPNWNAVIVADDISLYAGDGEQFDQVVTVESSQGHRVQQLAHRGDWTQIRTADGHVGWVRNRDIESMKAAYLDRDILPRRDLVTQCFAWR